MDSYQRPALMPADTPDNMVDAWASCMSWAIGEADVRAAFERDTGHAPVKPPKNKMEAMIDEATGYAKYSTVYTEEFIKWANVAIWGPIDADDC